MTKKIVLLPTPFEKPKVVKPPSPVPPPAPPKVKPTSRHRTFMGCPVFLDDTLRKDEIRMIRR